MPPQNLDTHKQNLFSKLSVASLTSIWGLKYRFFIILMLLVATPILYASNFNSPQNVEAVGYEKLGSNGVISSIGKTGFGTTSESLGKIAMSIAKNSSEFAFIKGLNTNDAVLKNIQGVVDTEVKLAKTRPLNDIIKAPGNPQLVSFLRYPKYNINVPIQYAQLKDLFQTDADGNLKKDDKGKYIPYEENVERDGPLGVPIQKLLVDGIVHIGFTPQPGEIGNSYIVGHSSNFSTVQSNYNYIFKPLESRSEVGEEFFVYDKDGRELKFKVFDTRAILEDDVAEAYKSFEDKRVVTLQCSILEYVQGKGWQPTKRWLTRGELVI
jgi:Sortase domain